MTRISHFITRYRTVLILFALTAIFASVQSLFLGKKNYIPGGIQYNTYNNYTIFKQSFYHLVDNKDLYILYPMEHWDLFKYSPTFAFLFGVFAVLPDMPGLTGWNLLNALMLVIGIYYLPHLSTQQKGWIAIACIMESMTAIQNEQSNGMMAGLIILAFGLSERKKYLWATFCIVLTVYIKIFGIVAFAIFLFYDPKWRIIVFTMLWAAVFLILPLLVVDLYQLKFLYKSWSRMLGIDHDVSQGLSVIGWLQAWFAVEANKMLTALTGAVLFLLPYVRWRCYAHYYFRLLALASLLIWIVIFNHKAESPTFIIAMAGVAIWFFMRPRKWWDVTLFISAILFTSLSTTDLVPAVVKKNFFEPYVLKAVPGIFIWLRIIVEMILYRDETYNKESFSPSQRSISVA